MNLWQPQKTSGFFYKASSDWKCLITAEGPLSDVVFLQFYYIPISLVCCLTETFLRSVEHHKYRLLTERSNHTDLATETFKTFLCPGELRLSRTVHVVVRNKKYESQFSVARHWSVLAQAHRDNGWSPDSRSGKISHGRWLLLAPGVVSLRCRVPS